jgi:phosphinothricin acetyltransferase
MMFMKVAFEALKETHANDVIDILNYYAENSFAAYPENKIPYVYFEKFLEIASKYPAYAIIREDGAEVIGFCLLRPYNPLPTFQETVEISYFINNSAVGQGIGTQALNRLEQDARKLGIKNILASIVSLNEPSLRFHRKNGFIECGSLINVGKKFGTYFDIIWMQKELK